MKILFITATYPPSANGVAIAVKNLKDKLEDKGHEVLVVAPKNKENLNSEHNVVYYPSADNPLNKDYPIPLFPITHKTLKQVDKFEPDIIHVHHPFHIGYFGSVLSKRFDVPLVFTYHTKYDYYAEKYFEFLPESLKKNFVQNSVKEFCNKVDLIIAPSRYIKNEILGNEFGNGIVTIPTIPNDLHRTSLSKERLRKMLDLPIDKKIVLTVGRLSVEKKTDLLVKSMEYLSNDFILVVCGSGPLEKSLNKFVKKNDLEKKILFTGKVDRKNISKYYEAADVFYFASDSETQGLIFWEALNFGLPVVAVDTSVSQEWIKPGWGILTQSKPKLLADAVNEIFTEKYKKASEKGYRFSRKFSSGIFVDKLVREYKRTIDGWGITKRILETGWQSWSIGKK